MSSKNAAAAANASVGTSKNAPIKLSDDDDDSHDDDDDESANSTASPTLLSPPTKTSDEDSTVWTLKLSMPQQQQQEDCCICENGVDVVVMISISPNATLQNLEALATEKLFAAKPASSLPQSIVLKHGFPPKNLVTSDNTLDKLSSLLENHARILVTLSACNNGSRTTAASTDASCAAATTADKKRAAAGENNTAVEKDDSTTSTVAPSSKRQRLVQEISGMKVKAMKLELLGSYGVSCTTILEKDEIVRALVDARLNNQQCTPAAASTAAAAATAAPSYPNNNKNYTIESPIKLLQTNLDRTSTNSKNSPLVQEHCLSMRQLLGLDSSTGYQMPPGCRIDWLIISNFMIQFDYLVHDVLPELVSIPTSVIFYECDCSSPGSSTRRQLEQNPNVDVVEISPKAEPRRNNDNNTINSPNPCRYKFPFGTHHTKMFLIGRSNGTLRVIIHTCNIIQGDAAVKAQGAYIQDFPLKDTAATESSSCSTFEDDLIDYMNTYGYERQQTWGPAGQGTTGSRPRTTLCQELKRYDFSSAKGVLIASTPGYYALDSDEANNRGYLKLSKAIREHCPTTAAAAAAAASLPWSLPWSPSPPFSPIVCQFSSVGALSEKYLREFCSKLNAGQEPCTNLAKSLKLVFPTPDDIRNSVEGYVGGGTVPSKKTNVYKPFLKPLWHRWTSPSVSVSSPTTWPLLKPNNVPHIKTYYQLMSGDSDESSSMQWFCLTSHNLSKAAWGEVRKNDRGQHLYVPSWELGVFVAPSMFDTQEEKASGIKVKMVSISAAATGSNASAANSTATRTVGIPLPYAINPTKYEANDRPFSWEETYPLPDRFGRKGVRG